MKLLYGILLITLFVSAIKADVTENVKVFEKAVEATTAADAAESSIKEKRGIYATPYAYHSPIVTVHHAPVISAPLIHHSAYVSAPWYHRSIVSAPIIHHSPFVSPLIHHPVPVLHSAPYISHPVVHHYFKRR